MRSKRKTFQNKYKLPQRTLLRTSETKTMENGMEGVFMEGLT